MSHDVLNGDHADLGIGALELFVEVLSQSDPAAAVDGFYDHLCEAVCRLARMRRALIFRYDSADRRVRAVGAHGMDIEPFAGAYVTVESAPIAAQAIRRDEVVEVVGDLSGQVPEEFAALVSEPARLVCAPMAAADRALRRHPRRPADGRAAAGRGRPPPAVDAGQGGGAGLGGADRLHPVREGQPARAAHRPRPRAARGCHPAPVRRLDGARRRRRAARVGPPALRRGDPGGAHGPARDAAAPAGTRAARHPDDPRGGGDAARRGPSRSRSLAGGRASASDVPPALEPLAQSVLIEAVRNAAQARPAHRASTCGWAGPTAPSGWRSSTTGCPSARRRPGMGLRLAALEALQSNGVIEFGEREPGTWQVRLVVPDEDDD